MNCTSCNKEIKKGELVMIDIFGYTHCMHCYLKEVDSSQFIVDEKSNLEEGCVLCGKNL